MNVLIGIIVSMGVAIAALIFQLRAERADNLVCETTLSAALTANENLREDKESDATVTDPNVFVVPDSWLLPVPDTGE